MRPVPGNASCSRTALPPVCLWGYRRFVGLRSLLAVSSVASGRIEFVSQALRAPLFYRLSIHFQLLSTSPRGDAVTFSLWWEAPPQRDFHPPVHSPSQAHERGLQPAGIQDGLRRRHVLDAGPLQRSCGVNAALRFAPAARMPGLQLRSHRPGQSLNQRNRASLWAGCPHPA